MKILISEAYKNHYYLLASTDVYDEEKEVFRSILSQKADLANIGSSLRNLSQYLYRHHRTKVVLLIDEYDTPIQSAYMHQYYDEMIILMRHLFGAGLKDNPNLHKAVMTGILRVAKESLFSGLNNLKVYTTVNQQYSQYFGFTEEEVNSLLYQAQFKEKIEEVKNWYNGYQFGQRIVYNPWSL